MIFFSSYIKEKWVLNESHPGVFQTIILPLFRTFQVKLIQDQLAQVEVRKVQLGQVKLVQFRVLNLQKLWGDSPSSDSKIFISVQDVACVCYYLIGTPFYLFGKLLFFKAPVDRSTLNNNKNKVKADQLTQRW